MRSAVRYLGIILFCFLFVAGLQAQTGTGVLHGQVTDQTGAVVTKATVIITAPDGNKTTVQTNASGVYDIRGLASGKYSLRVIAKGFATYDLADITVAPGATPALDISLDVAVEEQKVTVEGEATNVNTDADSNANTVVIKGKDLDALSDDPDELQSDLEALAGPSAGPNGGQIYIDGFSNGTLPPKSSIREIRINQNPFSAQYDRLGFGRVEVFTKPGKDKFHGQFMTMVNHSIFNSRNPFLESGVSIPDYHSDMFNGNFSGPINSKASFFIGFNRRALSDVAIASGGWIPCAGFDLTNPCTGFDPRTYGGVYPNPNIHTEVSPRIDYQLTANNTMTARYEYERTRSENNGIAQFSLPSQLNVDTHGTEHNVQISDTQVINPTMINETRFQFVREDNLQKDLSVGALASQPAISVFDAFSAGSSRGNSSTTQNHYELQNYTSKVHGTHFIRFGGRVRVNNENIFSTPNQFGTFTYSSTTAYYLVNYFAPTLTLVDRRNACVAYIGGTNPSFTNGWAMNPSSQPVVPYPTTPADCGISQFTQTTGNPSANISQTDAGLYAEDDWRVLSNVTLSYGLRFETQNNVDNKANFAPRLGIAWGLGKSKVPKTVLRAGFGMFYDRFSQGNVLQVIRTSSSNPQQIFVSPDPNSLNPEDLILSGQSPIVYQINPHLQIPYTMQVAATLERQLTKTSKVTVSYIGSRGLHQLAMENIVDPVTNAETYRYDSNGTFKQHQLMVNSNFSIGKYASLMGWYVYGHANSNTNGGFPSEPFNLNADWGRSSFDVRHRGMIMGNINLPYGFRLNPMIIASSSRPYNIYGPFDLNGDNILSNDRPWFSNGCNGASSGRIYNTVLGCFSMDPTSSSNLGRVPVNYANGPAMFVTNLRISKTFGIGKKAEASSVAAGGGPGGPGGGRGPGGGGMPGGRDIGRMMGMGASSGQRYSLTFSASARNLFNHVNAAPPSGNLSSPTFAEPTALSGMGPFSSSSNRRIDLQVQFSF